jgi:hypothetical protein
MLTLQKRGAAAEQVTFAITAEDRAMLESFAGEEERLAACTALKKSPRPMSIIADPDRGPIVEAPLPPDDDLIVLLHRSRPFILNDEPYSYNRVAGRLGKSLSPQPIRDVLNQPGPA